MLLSRILARTTARPEPAAVPEVPIITRRRVRSVAPSPVSAGPAREAPAPAPTSVPPAPGAPAFGPGFLSEYVRREDDIPQHSRVGTEFVHVSSLASLCTRAYSLADTYSDTLADERVTGGHKVMWRIGRAVERHFRESFIEAGGEAWGRWRCPCQRTVLGGGLDAREHICSECGSYTRQYVEFTLTDTDAMISGNPDLLVDIGSALFPVEIKSMKGDQWTALTAPLPDHLFQVQAYRRLLVLNGFRVSPLSALVYITKDFRFGSPYKEFHVAPDPTIENLLDDCWEQARELHAARQADQLPRRLGVCQSVSSPRARRCPVSARCFLRSNA